MARDLFDPPAIVQPAADALAELAGRINAEHQQAEQHLQAGLRHAKNAGDLLIEAKKQCRHGEWLPWVKANVKPAPRTVQAYMRVSRRWADLEAKAKAQGLAHLTFEDGLKLLAEEPEARSVDPKELRRQLWTSQWRAAGARFPASTGAEYRERFRRSQGFWLNEELVEESDQVWDGLLYEKLAQIGGAYKFKTGDKRLPPPGDLEPKGREWEGPNAEQNRAVLWDLYTSREVGKFLRWCDTAGILKPKGKGMLGIDLEREFSTMAEAAGTLKAINQEEKTDWTPEQMAERFEVSLAELPRTLYTVANGYVFAFLSEILTEEQVRHFLRQHADEYFVDEVRLA